MKTNDTPKWRVALVNPLQTEEDAQDIAQCVYTILSTVKGSDPLRPDFGSDVYKYLDKPMNATLPALVMEVGDAVEKWEKRIRVTKCRVITVDKDKKGIAIEAETTGTPIQMSITVTL